MTAQDSTTATGAEQDLIIARTYDAPRELVWRTLTEAEHLAQWWGPKGVEIRVNALDVRPGGVFHYCMVSPQGDIWGKFVYRQIDRPERLEFTSGFADAEGNFAPGPYFEIWPLEILNIWTLEEVEGKTTFRLRGRPHNASPEEERAFREMFPSMQGGWKGTLDKLGEHLQAQSQH